MRERIAGFADVVFGLMLALLASAPAQKLALAVRSPAAYHDALSLLMPSLVDFAIVLGFWSLQSYVLSKLYVRHVAFVLGFAVIFYLFFGWAATQALGDELLRLLPASAISAFGKYDRMSISLPAYSSSILFVLAVAGTAFHWVDGKQSKFECYENLRQCLLILVMTIALFALADPAIRWGPLDPVMLLALIIVLRALLLGADDYFLRLWGTAEERRHAELIGVTGSAVGFMFVAAVIVLNNAILRNGATVPLDIVLVPMTFWFAYRVYSGVKNVKASH